MDSNESDIPAEEYIAPQHEAEENDTETIPPPSAANNSSASVIEFEPPLASIKRLLKQTLPANTIISKDALSAITRACGIFIIYITACANDCARENKRSTISANDILSAIKVRLTILFFTHMFHNRNFESILCYLHVAYDLRKLNLMSLRLLYKFSLTNYGKTRRRKKNLRKIHQ